MFLACNLLPAAHNYCHANPPGYIRVAIVQDADSVSLKANGSYEVVYPEDRQVLHKGRNLKTTVAVYKGGIFMAGKNFNTDKLLVRLSDPGNTVSVDGRRFRGNIRFIKKSNGRLLVINHIDLEDYVRGILYNEVSHYWPMGALKAQAIACRAYALYQMQVNASKDYDVTSDVYSQVYGGRASERYRTNKAVGQTRGYALTYQGKVLPAYYHATCGGHTQDVSLLWNIDLLPLKGVICNFCKDSPHFKWHKVLSQDEMMAALAGAGYDECTEIKDILIISVDGSGRNTGLKIVTDKKEIIISAKDFRNIIGPNTLRSANFKVHMVNQEAVFEGFGWGHGVGLCQWGAYFMAKQGRDYREILEYYYPGCQVSLIDIKNYYAESP